MRKMGGRLRLEGREQNWDVFPQISLCLVITGTGCFSWWGWALGCTNKAIVPAWQPFLNSYISHLVPVTDTPLIPLSLGVVTGSLCCYLARASPCPVLSISPDCTSANSHFIKVIPLLLLKVRMFSARTLTAHHFLLLLFLLHVPTP